MSSTKIVVATPETHEFWEAASRGDYLLKHCNACGQSHYYPRSICPRCFSSDTKWIRAAGEGTIYSHSIAKRDGNTHVIAYVTLDEGPTILTNIVDTDPDDIHIGARVRLKFEPFADGRSLAMFEAV